MGFQICEVGRCFLVCILSFLSLVYYVNGSLLGDRVEAQVNIDGRVGIAQIDENFICATLDWWPPEKCDYGTCSWGHASLLNLDLSNPILLNAIRAFSPLKIRLGGSLQDKVIYETKDSKPCDQFSYKPGQMFGFTPGCLPMKRWDELNAFFKEAGPLVVFGLNALNGRSYPVGGDGAPATGAWDSSNAESLIRYTVEKGYPIYGWELGNELSGPGVGTRVAADQYASDLITLHKMLEEIYKGSETKPLVIAPGGFYDENWYTVFLNKTPNYLDVLTHHIYNLGPGSHDDLIGRILSYSVLDNEVGNFRNFKRVLKSSGNSAVSWVGEAGGAFNSGRNHVTNAFVSSFWFLDQLGMASKFDTKTYCRQTLIGGNYGLLNTTTFVPNPDYYSALLWHRLMGRTVLSVNISGPYSTRAYAHCSKISKGITLLLINLDGNSTVQANAVFNGESSLQKQQHSRKTKSRIGRLYQGIEAENVRAEYHLTAKDGDLQSQVMLLNGEALAVNPSGEIPPFTPLHVNSTNPISVGPFSIVFVHMPFVLLPACK